MCVLKGRWEDQPLPLSPPPHTPTKANSMWEMLQMEQSWREKWKKHSPRIFFVIMWVWILFLRKSAHTLIQWQTVQGRFFRNTELFTVSLMLIYMSNWYKGTLPPFFSFQTWTQCEINATRKHTMPWIIPSFVF